LKIGDLNLSEVRNCELAQQFQRVADPERSGSEGRSNPSSGTSLRIGDLNLSEVRNCELAQQFQRVADPERSGSEGRSNPSSGTNFL